MPTVLEALGADQPGHLQGESLWPLLTGARPEQTQKPAFSEWNGRLQWMHKRHAMFDKVSDFHIRTVRTPDWKLNVNPGDTWELYDLRNDPGEMVNRIHDPDCQPVVQGLLGELRAWQGRVGDTLEVRC